MFLALTMIVPAMPGEFTLLQRDTLEIPVAQYRSVNFEVPVEMSTDAMLSGNIIVSPDTASVELILLHIDDYLRWRENAGNVDTLDYASLGSDHFQLNLPGLGSYSLVVSNRGNYVPVSVVMEIRLICSESGSGDPLPAAMRLTLLLMMLGVIAFAVGSVLVRHRKRPSESD